MQTTKLMTGILSAWGMAITYEKVEMAIGLELHMLLIGAVVAMVAGLYFGTRDNKSV